MSVKLLMTCVVALAAGAASQAAEPSASNPIDALLPRPDIVMRHREDLSLSGDQIGRIQKSGEEQGPKLERAQQAVNRATERLAEALSADNVDEDAAVRLLDELLDAEKEQRRLHLQIMIRLRNELTAEQRETVAKLQRAGPGSNLAWKIQRVQQRAQKMQQDGQDVSAIQKLMRRIGPLVQQGKHHEAGKLLDEALKLTGEQPKSGEDADDAAAEAKTSAGSALRRLKSTLPTDLSRAEVRTEVAALIKKDVEWRKIAWKTCLIDGLNASREQKKPVILWIFIDRPINDERC